MFQGNWKCSSCGGKITELPFQPRSEAGLTCRSCFMKSRDNAPVPEADAAPATTLNDAPDFAPIDAAPASEPVPGDDAPQEGTPVAPGEKPKFRGDWKCATCGGAITSLPFEPRSTENLKCIDCFKASKG